MKNERYNSLSLSQETRAPSHGLTGISGVPAMIRKPLSVMLLESNEEGLDRHLTLFDLVVLGVAGTLGTGIFAIVGIIGHEFAGPAGIVSWMLAGFGCLLSGLSYAELSSVIPSAGGAYAYAFVALGELPAIITAWCLSLEFGVSSAAVARVWAYKILQWLMMGSDSGMCRFMETVLDPLPGSSISPLAACLMALSVLVLTRGVAAGKNITTVLTALKMAICAFIIIAGLALFKGGNLVPFAPMGFPGIVKGSSAAFFGYLGYDEVCFLAGEAINPRKNVPLSVAYTLIIASFSYVLSALALAGMVPAGESPAGASFVLAFIERGWGWASKVVAIGEIVTLPVVVLAAFMVQPRLLSVLASDGLLPKFLSATDEQGLPRTATLVSGAVLVLAAGVIPLNDMQDFISAGVLMCFAITNSCAIIVRREARVYGHTATAMYGNEYTPPAPRPRTPTPPLTARSTLDPAQPGPCRPLILVFNGLCLLTGLLVKLALTTASGAAAGGTVTAADVIATASGAAAGLSFLAAWVVMLAVSKWCPEPLHPLGGPQAQRAFRGPFSPWVPALGIAVNWFLFAQLSWGGLLCTLWAIAGVCVWYFVYGLKHSVGQKSRIWPQLAAATALAASETSTVFDPPSLRPYNIFCNPGGAPGSREPSPKRRITFSDDDPLDSPPSPANRAGRVEGEGWGDDDGAGLPSSSGQPSDGYTSVADLI